MTGIFVNALCVVFGGMLGTLCSRFLPKRIEANLNDAFGVCSVGMGVSSVVLVENLPPVVFALILGTALGTLLRFGDFVQALGGLLKRPVSRLLPKNEGNSDGQKKFDSLLLTALVLFCASATGIYGSLDAGMTGNCEILISKAILDFFTAIVFSCTLGLVMSLVAIPQVAVLSLLFFLARLIVPLTDAAMISDFKACGGFILIATGLRISNIREFPIADMTPAMILVMPCSWAWTRFVAGWL